MRGTMMDFPLTLPHLLDRAGFLFARSEMLSRCPRGTLTRTTYADFHRRARRLASALTRLGLQPGDRVSTMMWTHATHMHLFFGIPCAGGIINPLNLRLHPQELAAIANHAGSRFLIVDDALLPVYESLRVAGASFRKSDRQSLRGWRGSSGLSRLRRTARRRRRQFRISKARRKRWRRRCFSHRARPAPRRPSSTRIARSCSTASRSLWRIVLRSATTT